MCVGVSCSMVCVYVKGSEREGEGDQYQGGFIINNERLLRSSLSLLCC